MYLIFLGNETLHGSIEETCSKLDSITENKSIRRRFVMVPANRCKEIVVGFFK
jgi:hypothetical protein